MKYYNTLPEEQETIINLDYYFKLNNYLLLLSFNDVYDIKSKIIMDFIGRRMTI